MQAIFIRNILSAASCSTTTLLSLVEQQPPPTKSLLSTLFVQPCHSLADPPSGCMNGWGRSIHWPCVPTHCPYCKQQRPVCSADCITTPLTSSSIGLRALMQLCNTSPDTVSRGYGGRRVNWMWQFMGLLSYHYYTELKMHILIHGEEETHKKKI